MKKLWFIVSHWWRLRVLPTRWQCGACERIVWGNRPDCPHCGQRYA